MGFNQASMESKDYLVSMLRPPIRNHSKFRGPDVQTVNPFYIDTQYKDKNRSYDTLAGMNPSLKG